MPGETSLVAQYGLDLGLDWRELWVSVPRGTKYDCDPWFETTCCTNSSMMLKAQRSIHVRLDDRRSFISGLLFGGLIGIAFVVLRRKVVQKRVACGRSDMSAIALRRNMRSTRR